MNEQEREKERKRETKELQNYDDVEMFVDRRRVKVVDKKKRTERVFADTHHDSHSTHASHVCK